MAKELKLYLPIILQDIADYEALSNAETPFMQDLEDKTNQIVEDSFLSTMSESRLVEWENALGLIATNSSLTQRRSLVLSRFRGTGKLSKTLIRAIVNAFTGGGAMVAFEDGVVKVGVTPPTSTFADFSIHKVTEELLKRKPAHLLMTVELSYISWGQIRNAFSTWQDVYDYFNNWNDVSLYFTTQEG